MFAAALKNETSKFVVLAIDSKALPPLGPVQTQPTRPSSETRGSEGESAQRAAANFLERLAPDVRERLGRSSKEAFNRPDFDEFDQGAQKTEERQGVQQNAAQTVSPSSQARAYSAPLFTANLVLLQSQPLVASDAGNEGLAVSSRQRERVLKSYHDAGAQPGGESAAFEAAIRRRELEQKTLIVPPVITTVNFTA